MPECIEIEMYRRPLQDIVGRTLTSAELPDLDYLRPAGLPADALLERTESPLLAVRRIGKLLLLDHGSGTLGLRFGMTGRLLIDEVSPIDKLEYSSGRNDPAWDRVALQYGPHRVAVRDPRRLGSIELDPDETQLGPDAWTLTTAQLDTAFAGRTAAVKTLLLNQKVVAGLGNLLADETLWRVGLRPDRSVQTLSAGDIDRLAEAIRETVEALDARGGSHTGDAFTLRAAEARCTRDGESMRHATVGGRSTWWCPAHQR
jgi:formamidopyrimidine-DNA glycosylase